MNPPYAIIQVMCCLNCAYHTFANGDWCALNDEVTIPDGYCRGYKAEEEGV